MKFKRKFTACGNPDVLWFGDFNAVLNAQIDANVPRQSRFSLSMNNFIENNDLTDVWRYLHPNEKRYTCYTQPTAALSRLDLFLASPTFLTHIVSSEIHPAYCSDHCPISIDFTLAENERGKGFYRIPNFLLQETAYCKLIQQTILDTTRLNQEADPAVLWDLVKAKIRGVTIKYLSESKWDKKCRIEAVEGEIAQAPFERDVADTPDMIEHYSSKVKFLQIELDDIYIALNIQEKEFNIARKYYESGRSTKYHFKLLGFHNQSIKCFKNESGQLVYSDSDILKVCHRFYSRLYCQETKYSCCSPSLRWEYLQNIPCNRIDSLNSRILSTELTLDELYNSLKSMSSDKSPGEDGLTVEFYRTFWPSIRLLVFGSVRYAFTLGRMSISQRRGIVRLIPKPGRDAQIVSNWRPITLLNVDYKLVTKSLCTRLSLMLPNLINHDQRGFMKGRYIGDNIMDLYACIKEAQLLKDQASALILLDIETLGLRFGLFNFFTGCS